MMDPKVSIIIPVYNVEAYLPQCLDSVVNQTYKNLEIICVNDGATDTSLSILESYASQDDRIKVVSKNNGGLSSARNEGHKYVTGQYMMYLDSDDWMDLTTCEVAVRKAEKENADVVFWNYIREFDTYSKPKTIFEDTEIIFDSTEELQALQRRFIGLYGEELKRPENADSIVTAWGKLYRSELIINNKIEFVDTKIIGTSEDALFNLEVFENVKKAIYVKDFFYHYRKDNLNAFTKKYKKNLFSQWYTLFEILREHILVHDCPLSFEMA